MKELLLAFTGSVVLGSSAFADPTQPAGPTGLLDPGANSASGVEGWSALDREISNFAAYGSQLEDEAGWTVLLRSYYTSGTKAVSIGPSGAEGPKVGGFSFQDVDIAFWRSIGQFDFRASVDLVDTTTTNVLVEDAYVLFDLTSVVQTTLGQFKAPVFNSAIISPENQLFIDRTAIGSAFDTYDMGLMAGGQTEAFDWATWVQNGSSGQAIDHTYGLRIAWNTGAGAGHREGARDKRDGLNGTVGVMYLGDDTNKGDSRALGIDVNGNYDRIGFGLDILWLDDDLDSLQTSARDFGVVAAGSLDFDNGIRKNATAYAGTVSYALNDRMEVGLRSESLDDREETFLRSAVFNYHRLRNMAKFSLQWTHVDTNSANSEGHYFKAGVSVGANR